jgi:hypothetical protein
VDGIIRIVEDPDLWFNKLGKGVCLPILIGIKRHFLQWLITPPCCSSRLVASEDGDGGSHNTLQAH